MRSSPLQPARIARRTARRTVGLARSLARTLALGAPLGLAACGGGAEPPRPNVVLVSIDTLRADHLGSYGYARDTSPRIDALAAAGVTFLETTSTTSWTLPAHLSMLTGLTVSAHGICDDRLWQAAPATGGDAPTSPLRGTFLPEVLKAAGYRTAGFHSWKYLEQRFGFGPGFDVYERVGYSIYSHPEWGPRFRALREAGDTEAIQRWFDESPELFDEQRPTSGEAVDRALAWLEENAPRGTDDAPVFLFLHLFDVHDDYVPPPPYDTRFDPDYEGPIDGRHVTSPDSPVRADMDPRDLAHLVALYDGEIAWVDSQVGRVVDWLAAAGLAERTLLVVTADHGEEFFEHGGKTHRSQLYRESVHVPWILRWPAELPAGLRVEGPTGLVDLAPTIYGLLGLEAPDGLSGADLSAVARGEAANGTREYASELYLFAEGAVPERQLGLLRGAEHVLLRSPPDGAPTYVRYDLAADPTERGPGERGVPGAAWTDAVDARVDALRDRTRAERERSRPRGGVLRPLDEAERQELADMGYVGGDEAAGPHEGPGESGRLCLDGCVWGGG